LHQLCASILHHVGRLPAPQRDALATVLTLLAEVAEQELLVCLVDDLTRTAFAGPITRLLREGELDGSFGGVCRTYFHLRREHRWAAERAMCAVLDLALGDLLPRPGGSARPA
jgi:hypothetical protein